MLHRRELLKRTGIVAPLWLVGYPTFAAPTNEAAEMIVHQRVPHNAEPRLDQLTESWLTPNDRFYVRSHAPVPEIDIAGFRLSIDGMVERPQSLSLRQLKNDFDKQSVVATLTCAGNRRSEHSLVKPIKGVAWQAGAIGNARWGGVRLSDLLRKAGIRAGASHVLFEGVDEIDRDGSTIPFGASIPLKKALADTREMPGALVAFDMNGERLSADHGYPLRTVVPGYIGARSVKWLGKITLSDRPSPNHYVATAYKLVTNGTEEEWSAASPIQTYVLNSVTCIPASGAKLAAGKATVRGYSLAAGAADCTVQKVELSTDGGKNWSRARFTSQAKPYCWRLWRSDVSLHNGTSQLIVRATDSAGNTQPKTVPWNLKGYLFNAWHKTTVQVQ